MKKLLIILLVLGIGYPKMAEAQKDVLLYTYNNQKETVASSSITFKNGFTVLAGTTFSAYISNPAGAVQNDYYANKNINYVVTHLVKQPGLINPSDTASLNVHVNTTIDYIDGEGKTAASVAVKASPGLKSILQYREYDNMGREKFKYLPYAGSAQFGTYLPNYHAVLDYYNTSPNVTHTAYPFSETKFEESPLNRVVEQGAPGAAWQLSSSGAPDKGHIVKWTYDTQQAPEALYKVLINNTTGVRTLSRANTNTAVYAKNALTRTVILDENNPLGNIAGSVLECKDRNDRLILKRQYNKNGATTEVLATYYVYDDFGNLCFVLPPAANPDANAPIAQATLDDFCYQYKYDGRQRMTAKKLPGKGWEYMVYNKMDQLILTQDAVQRSKSPQEWAVTKYDALGRAILNGIYTYGTTPSTDNLTVVQGLADAVSAQWETRITTGNGYSSTSFPATLATTLSVNYFDDYLIPGLPADAAYNQSADYTEMTRGLATASKVNVIGTSNYLWNVSYYDDEGRNVKGVSQHYKGGVLANNNYDEVSNTYNFAGELTASVREHYVAGVESLYLKNEYKYDPQGRKKDTYQTTGSTSATIVNTPVLLSRNEYDEMGQLKWKRLHSVDGGVSFKQNIAYTYNERGWLSSQIAPLFSETLKYNEAISGVTPQYNGNISRQEWTGSKYYNYRYDNLNRLTSAIASTGNNEAIGYDLMGNITRLQRKLNSSLIDQMKYTYTGGNKLSSVLDTNANVADSRFQLAGTTGYVYDVNGNMTSRTNAVNAGNNLTSISYNFLNLPKTMTFGTNTITYTYGASGNKLRKVVGSIVNNDYIGGIHYEGGAFVFAQTEVGRVVKNGSGADPVYSYEYTLSDHLGNGRVYFDIYNGVARKVQEDEYYAFGLPINIGPVPSFENKYQYNGKEKQDQEKMFDYGARFYDPVIGRFTAVDNLAEEMRSHSVYNYGLNNPMRYTDPDGNAPTDIILRGAANSSVTIKTELIDIEVNASSLGINFGGNYTLQGDDILQAGLDVVGIFDPTGIADGVNAGISAKKGDWLNAGISALGVIPLAGDLAKAGKIEKDVKIISNAVDAVKTEAKAEKSIVRSAEALPSPGKGRGTVSPGQRDPKRVYSKSERAEMLKKQDGKCVGCGETKTVDQVAGHHKKRHADGGATTAENGAAVCKDCHIKIHQ